jgi:phage gp29-like protein
MKKPVPNKTVLTARVIKTDDLMGSFMGYMPNPDEVLRDTGEALGVYREMKTDPRVKSLLSVAKGAILNYPVRLERADASDRVMDLCARAADRMPFYELEKRLLSGIDYGFAAVELVWENVEGWWLPSDVVLRKPERFSFDAEGRLKYRHNGEMLDLYGQEYKWLVWRFDKDAENPYGTSALKACYWPWKFKKAGAEFWLMATERFSVPSILALFESQEGEDKTRARAVALSELLTQVSPGSGAALANVKEIKTLEASGALSEFRALMDWCDTQIAYGIVQQSLAVQEAENGTRAQAEVHQSTFLSTAKNVCREIESVLQDVVDWVVELNFGTDEAKPRVEFDLADYASWEEVRDAIDRNVPVSRSALYERYGLPEPADEDDSFVKPEGSAGGFGLSDKAAPSDKKKARTRVMLLSGRR